MKKEKHTETMSPALKAVMSCQWEEGWDALEKENSPRALLLRAFYYALGLPPCEKNSSLYRLFYKKAADEGDLLAKACLEKEKMGKEDWKEAKKKLLKEKDPFVFYWLGMEAADDDKEAKTYFEKGAKLGFWACMDQLGLLLRKEKGEEKKAYDWFLKAAALGWKTALFHLGECYEQGIGVDQDLTKAVQVYDHAVRSGSGEAASVLGLMYAEGRGVEEDPEKALAYYKQSVSLGAHDAEKNIGDAYFYGQGTEKDHQEADLWYHRAFEHGSLGAAAMISVLLGEEGEKEEAFQWMQTAALGGNSDGMTGLGEYYLQGFGTKADPEKGIHWLKMGARQNNAEAQMELGILYRQAGQLFDAFTYFRKAAKQGYPQAMNFMAVSLARGEGADEDKKEALRLLKKSAALGDQEAPKLIDLLQLKDQQDG
jgi:TPR repeat protein